MATLAIIVVVIVTAFNLIKDRSPWTDWLIVMPAVVAGAIAFTARSWLVTIIAMTAAAGLLFLATHNLFLSIGVWVVMLFINAIRGPEE